MQSNRLRNQFTLTGIVAGSIMLGVGMMSYASSGGLTAMLSLIAAAMAFSMPFLLRRSLFTPLNRMAGALDKLAQGDYTEAASVTEGDDEIGQVAQSLSGLKSSLNTNSRVKQALDGVTSNVMMADENFNIVYVNESLNGFLKEAERDIQKDLPRFSVANLMGTNIDVFHKNPAHQRGMLTQMSAPTKTSIQVGGRSFNLVATPLFDQNKKRIGTVVEWQDGAAAGMVDAINKSMAVIEFQTDGTIINANENFLSAMGYSLEELNDYRRLPVGSSSV